MSTESSLYDRVGGAATIATLVDAFYARVFADPELAPFFEHASREKLGTMQKEFFTAALGGPAAYTGRPLAHVHQGRGITIKHFQRFVSHLFPTLQDIGVGEDDSYEIISRINLYVDEIVGGATGVDG